MMKGERERGCGNGATEPANLLLVLHCHTAPAAAGDEDDDDNQDDDDEDLNDDGATKSKQLADRCQ